MLSFHSCGCCFIYIFEELSVVFFEKKQFGEVIRIISIGLFFGSLNTSLDLACQSVKNYKAAAYVQFYTAAAYCLFAIIGYSTIGYDGWLAGFSLSRSIGTLLYVRALWKWFGWYRGGSTRGLKWCARHFRFI